MKEEEKIKEKLEKLSIADLLAMFHHFADLIHSRDESYEKSCAKLVQKEWTKRRIEIFGTSE